MIGKKQLLLVFIPALLIAALALYIRIGQFEPLYSDTNAEEENIVDLIPVFADDPILGDKAAPTTIIAFEDFGCPACKVQAQLFDQLLDKYPGELKVVWKGLPVTRFPFASETAERYAYCANKQGLFGAFKQYAFANSDNLSESILQTITEEIGLDKDTFDTCLASGAPQAHISQVEELARILRIQSVPTLFVNGSQVEPPHSLADWESILDLQ